MSVITDVVAPGPNDECVDFQETAAPASDSCLFARSLSMRQLYTQIEKIASVDVPVLFLGESGVGKEYFARRLHQLSDRSSRPFLKVNCAALPSDLLESELFGYEAGAFTGATRSKPGQFELCEQGTILLDEIAEMPPNMQAKLLHVLQDQQFSRLGGRKLVQVNVRVMAATNVNIQHALAEGKFRADLYYRLNTIILSVPPLRERPEDIPVLLEQFVSETSERLGVPPPTISSRVLDSCLEYPWPGNVREMQSFVYRLLLQEDEETLLAELHECATDHLFENASGGDISAIHLGMKSLGRRVRAQVERRMISHALSRTSWNRAQAARMLGISAKSIRNKIREYKISAMS